MLVLYCRARIVYSLNVRKISSMNRTKPPIADMPLTAQKRAYTCPLLTVFGPLAQLTQGGPSGNNEIFKPYGDPSRKN